LLIDVIDQKVRPVTARVFIPALVRGDELITETGLFGQCIKMAQQAESEPPGLSAGVFIGNPFTDVPELGSYSFVTTNDEPELASRLALEIAERFWEHHERMQVPLISLEQMQQKMSQIGKRQQLGLTGTVALVDAADATSSGASGDSNAILKALLECGYTGRSLIPIVDRPAVESAFAAGIGKEIQVTLGGTLDPGRFEPMELRCRIRHLSDGSFRSESFGEAWDSGPTAVLESSGMTLVVGSRGVNLYDRSYFYANGQNPKRFDAVVVKSPHCQPHMYAAWCSEMLLIDAPGSSSANVRGLGHQRCQRPIFPLEPIKDYRPTVEIFRR
jgi:microcystin degradation protein MlrC